jgi:cytochrome c oxidase subunit I
VIDAASLATARRLTVSYIVASTVILAATGLLGVLMRWSQAVPEARIHDNFWYAIMTAHGLGAFVGWAGFAVMGLSFWILAGVGFPIRGFGLAMGRLTWWLMVLGVAGVVVTTIFMGFAASWVFLYPLPFYGSGYWGNWATGLFSFSVLLVGLSIVTWCFAILHTVVNKEALHSVSSSIGKRLGLSMGWGFLFPRTFATNPQPVPYPVIPLAVIGIDMIIATLPLAGLLVYQILQSIGWVGETNALLAKNILWWFGHPVVYLLLFPAVAVYYWLIPRYAGRQLVAGNVIAIAWTVAVIANVFVWAHHLYLDYPSGTSQAAINTAMQPITFSLVLPSALSLYSLGFTIYRSSYRWTPASTALFFGLIGWLLAGLSGVVNATIAFDVIIHNTLWIVGHFHHMAMLNIGLLIFGATYALLPELSGKALYSEKLAWVHVWITFVVGMIVYGIWEVQGLDGAPRRWSVLPSQFDTGTRIALAFVFVLAAGQALFFWNVLQTLLGKGGVATFDERGIPEPSKNPKQWTVHGAEAALVIILIALLVGFAIGGYYVGKERDKKGGATTSTPTTTTQLSESAEAGKAVFASASCGGCHTLSAADAKGAVGPSLDASKPSKALVVQRVTNGKGAMPAFKGQLSPQQIQDVAAYVSETAGK